MHTAAAIAASSTYGESTSNAPAAGIIVFLVLLYLAFLAFAIYCYVRVAQKAGYSGWYVALLFVPIANLVVSLMFVFKQWPIEAEVAHLRARVAQLEGGHSGFGQLPPGQRPYGQLPPGQPPYGQPPYGQSL
jgi:putative effector of murein hydrolase LrgA (UPF0299 family)